MPQAAAQQCSEPGCTELVDSGRCPLHRRQHDNRRQASTAKRGYDWKWERLRLSKLAANPLCEIGWCRGDGPMAHVATEVHHVIPITEAPQLRLEWSNLQSACEPCHRRKDAQRRSNAKP